MEKQSDRCSSFQESKDEIDSIDGKSNSDVGKLHVYSEEEAALLEERLNNKETFREALQVLISWLEEGLCNERSSAHFYTLIRICWNQFKKLKSEQKEYIDEVEKARESVLNNSCCLHLQLNKIEEVFEAIEKESIVDNFAEDQKNKIEEMKAEILGFKDDLKKGCVFNAVEDRESNSMKPVQTEDMQTKVGSSTSGNCDECLKEISRLNSELENSRKRLKKNNSVAGKQQLNSDVASQFDPDQVYPSEMDMISWFSVFLFKNPGVSIDRIYSHFREEISSSAEIENLMRRYPKIFEESSVGDDQKKKWTYIAVDPKTLTEFNNKQKP